jgi:hypothetical protein
MPFYWLEGYLEKYREHIKKRIEEQDSQRNQGKALDPSSAFRKYAKMGSYNSPKFNKLK